MATWTDGVLEESASVNSITEVQIGNNVNIPQGQTWNIRSYWVAHNGKGTYRISVDTLPAMRGEFVVTTEYPETKNANIHTTDEMVNYTISGPSIVKCFITPDQLSATIGIFNMKYQVTA